MDQAPWWGVPVIAGGFLILGAVLGFLFNLVMDRRRTKREDRVQIRTRLTDAVALFIEASREMDRVRPLGNLPPDVIEDRKEAVNDYYHRMRLQLTLFQLLSTDTQLVDSAEKALDAIYLFNHDADSHKAGDYNRLEQEAWDKRDALIAAARETLGVGRIKMGKPPRLPDI